MIMNDGINIEIDGFTPCLRRLSDGAIVGTTTRKVKNSSELPAVENWEFDWKVQLGISGEVVALYADGDPRVQGLAAVTDMPGDAAVFVDLVESAPHNNRHNDAVSGQEYAGVGPHLFACAIKLSVDRGYNGFIYFDAKSSLVDYYARVLGAVPLGSTTRMVVEGRAAEEIYNEYYGCDDR